MKNLFQIPRPVVLHSLGATTQSQAAHIPEISPETPTAGPPVILEYSQHIKS
jgi:hypothetical protein